MLLKSGDGGLFLSVLPRALTQWWGLGTEHTHQLPVEGATENAGLLAPRGGPLPALSSPFPHFLLLLARATSYTLNATLLSPYLENSQCLLELACTLSHCDHLGEDENPSPPKCTDHCACDFKRYGALGGGWRWWWGFSTGVLPDPGHRSLQRSPGIRVRASHLVPTAFWVTS